MDDIGVVDVGEVLAHLAVLAPEIEHLPPELDFVSERDGKLPEEGGLVGGGDQLALHDNREFGLVD